MTFNGVSAVIRRITATTITTTVPISAATGPLVVTTSRGTASRMFTVETTADFLAVRADAGGLEQAMLITLRFAELQSHGSVNRRIGIRVRDVRPSNVAVDIIDSGPGNIPELTADYFDLPFHTGHQMNRSGDRPDLGLADSILRGCGGSLHVSGSKTDGTTLTLVLPRAIVSAAVTRQHKVKA